MTFWVDHGGRGSPRRPYAINSSSDEHIRVGSREFVNGVPHPRNSSKWGTPSTKLANLGFPNFTRFVGWGTPLGIGFVTSVKVLSLVEGIVVGAQVKVSKQVKVSAKRRSVQQDEVGVVIRVDADAVNVMVDFGKDGVSDEIIIPSSTLSVIPQQKKDKATKKKKGLDAAADSSSTLTPLAASTGPAPQSPLRIAWVRQTDADTSEVLQSNVRIALRHMHLAFSPTQDVVGFVSEDGSPLMLQAAEPNTMKIVAYSSKVSLTCPENVHYIIIWFRMSGSQWQMLYLLDPREAVAVASPVVAADSPAHKKQKKMVGKLLWPFWNAITPNKNCKTREQSLRERHQ